MSATKPHISVRTYTIVFISLLVLLVLTVVAGYIDLGRANLPVAMAIATTKAGLIAYYFMHLKIASRWVAAFFLGSLYVLGLGAALTFADYMLRL